jgi:hypothetical protein
LFVTLTTLLFVDFTFGAFILLLFLDVTLLHCLFVVRCGCCCCCWLLIVRLCWVVVVVVRYWTLVVRLRCLVYVRSFSSFTTFVRLRSVVTVCCFTVTFGSRCCVLHGLTVLDTYVWLRLRSVVHVVYYCWFCCC